MSNVNTDGLPPEMQARIAQIIEGAKQKAAAPQQPQPQPEAAPVVRQPNLMDHVIALRQEVAVLRQQVDAMAQVTEAVGNAVGQLYNMFHQQTEPSSYSANFQAQGQEELSDY